MSGVGCYGLRVDGVPGAAHQLVPADPGFPVLTVVRERTATGPASDDRYDIGPDHADLPLSDGISRSLLDRRTGTARLSLGRDYDDEALIHPLLSGSCAVLNWWHGRDAMHAGAFVRDGRAWVVIGDKGQGKSTTLGFLATQQVPVVSDDLVVVSDGDVLAGPAFVDLRPDAARHLGVGRDLGRLGARDRFRLDVPTPPARVPLAGWLVLEWGDSVELEPLSVPQRITTLLGNRAVLLRPAAPQAFLAHAASPFYTLRRPKRWESLAEVAELLHDALP